MNNKSTDVVQVPPKDLRKFVLNIFKNVHLPKDHAKLIAKLLVDTDLRGVFTHGVSKVERYVNSFRNGKTNTKPNIKILRNGPVTAALNGDGGLGIIVATQAMEASISKAKEMGVGVTTTTYHDHIGSAGKYVRIAMRKRMIGICFSGRNAAPEYNYEDTIRGSIQGGPPIAFGIPPVKNGRYFLLDMSTSIKWDEECFTKIPQIYFKFIGLSHVANIASGTLGGQMLPEFNRKNIKYSGADQSGFFMSIDIGRFVPTKAFMEDVEHLIRETTKMKPLPGLSEATLPGGPEWKNEKKFMKEGIPISHTTKNSLEKLAKEYRVPVPW